MSSTAIQSPGPTLPQSGMAKLRASKRGDGDFRVELLLMFARNELSAKATLLLLAVVFSLASCFWAPWSQAGLWLVLVIGAKVILLEMCRRFQAETDPAAKFSIWSKRILIAEAINGCAWAGFALVGIDALQTSDARDLFAAHVFIFASLIVVLAMRMTLASPVIEILMIGTVPMTIAVVARLVLLQEFFFLAMALLAIGIHIYFIFLAMGLNSTAVTMLAYRGQKDSLISELELATKQSDIARRRAEAANIAKSRFLATMSHELRTPLNAILGFSEVMKDQIMGPLNNATYEEYVGNIHDSGSHLLKLINEILDLSRIEAGRYELHEEGVRVADIAQECTQLLRLRAESKKLNITLNLNERLPLLWADERAVRQICLNLLTNALKFTPVGGQIEVQVDADERGSQYLVVRDNGPGIPEDELPRVMESFGQGGLAHKTAEGGTGLGLPIVRKLVDLHGGAFNLKSKLSRGTEVTATFPASRNMRSMPASTAQRQRAGEVMPAPQSHQSLQSGSFRASRPARLVKALAPRQEPAPKMAASA